MPSIPAHAAPTRFGALTRGPWRNRLLVGAVAAIALAILWATGGLDAVATPPVTVQVVKPNQKLEAGPYNITVTNAAATDDLAPFKPSKEGNYLLAIAATIEVATKESLPALVLERALSVADVKGMVVPEGSLGPDPVVTPKYIVLVRDATNLEYVNPGLPERVAFIYEMHKDTPVPSHITVGLTTTTPHWDSIKRQYVWTDPAATAMITVDVANKVGAP